MVREPRFHKFRSKYLPKRRKTYARIYGRFKTLTGKIRGFEFTVKVSEKLRRSPKLLYKNIHRLCSRIKYDNSLPYHKRREMFSSFADVFGSPWVRVRKILDYDIHMDYPTPFDRTD